MYTRTHLLWAPADEEDWVDKRFQLSVHGLEGRVVGHPLEQIVGLAVPLHGHTRRHRVHADFLVQVLSVATRLSPSRPTKRQENRKVIEWLLHNVARYGHCRWAIESVDHRDHVHLHEHI